MRKTVTLLFTIALCSTNVFAMKKRKVAYTAVSWTHYSETENTYITNRWWNLGQYRYAMKFKHPLKGDVKKILPILTAFLCKKIDVATFEKKLINSHFYELEISRTIEEDRFVGHLHKSLHFHTIQQVYLKDKRALLFKAHCTIKKRHCFDQHAQTGPFVGKIEVSNASIIIIRKKAHNIEPQKDIFTPLPCSLTFSGDNQTLLSLLQEDPKITTRKVLNLQAYIIKNFSKDTENKQNTDRSFPIEAKEFLAPETLRY